MFTTTMGHKLMYKIIGVTHKNFNQTASIIKQTATIHQPAIPHTLVRQHQTSPGTPSSVSRTPNVSPLLQ
jgi:hypothetical protein